MNRTIPALLLPVVLSAALHCQPSRADWLIDGASSHLGFASVKNDVIGENHHFTGISGSVSDDGQVSVTVALASVETLIPIRNDRMREMLFDVANFPLATITAQVNVSDYTALAIGEQLTATVDLNIALHGRTVKKSALTKVVRSAGASFEVSSLGPLLIHASELGFTGGIDALRKIAGLDSIDLMVPVTFNLSLKESTLKESTLKETP